MKDFEVGYSYKIAEFGTINLQALNADEADDFGREHVYTSIPEATDITVDYVKEITVGS